METIEIIKDGVIRISHDGKFVELPFELVLCASDLIIERNISTLKKESVHVEEPLDKFVVANLSFSHVYDSIEKALEKNDGSEIEITIRSAE